MNKIVIASEQNNRSCERSNPTLKIIFLLLLIFCPAATLRAAEVIDRIVAVVNDDVITQSELEESMHPFIADYRERYGRQDISDKLDEAREDALNRLIEEKLLLQHAIKKEMEVDEKDIEERLSQVKSKFKREEEFYAALAESGMTVAKLRKRYREQLLLRKLVRGLISLKVHISPTQIAAYYYGNRNYFSVPETVRFKIIMLKPEEGQGMYELRKLTEKIAERINSGEDFDMLARQYSKGPNVDKGGDMGYMPASDILKELQEAISGMSLGEVSDPIQTETGFSIVELIDRKEARVKGFEEVKDFIRERLFQRESELALREFVNELRKEAYIKIQ